MNLSHLVVDAKVARVLGGSGLSTTASALHPEGGDCQTCVLPLSGTKMSLYVDVMAPTLAIASLHHAACKSSYWADEPIVAFTSGAATCAVSKWLLITETRSGTRELTPLLMVNPALESVFLHRNPLGIWQPSVSGADAGMTRNRPGHTPPPCRYPATIDNGAILVTVDDGMIYPHEHMQDGPDPRPLVQEVQRQRGIVFALTHAANPNGLVCDNSPKTNQENWNTESWQTAGHFASSTIGGGGTDIPAGKTVNGVIHSQWISLDNKKADTCTANPILLVHDLVPDTKAPMGLQPTDLAYWRLPAQVMTDGNKLVAEGKRLY